MELRLESAVAVRAVRSNGFRSMTFSETSSSLFKKEIFPGGVITILPMADGGIRSLADNLASLIVSRIVRLSSLPCKLETEWTPILAFGAT